MREIIEIKMRNRIQTSTDTLEIMATRDEHISQNILLIFSVNT